MLKDSGLSLAYMCTEFWGSGLGAACPGRGGAQVQKTSGLSTACTGVRGLVLLFLDEGGAQGLLFRTA